MDQLPGPRQQHGPVQAQGQVQSFGDMEDSVVADDPKPAAGLHQEPVFEPIGPGTDNDARAAGPHEDADTGLHGFPRARFARANLDRVLADWLAGIRTIRFWFSVAAAVLGTWAATGAVVLLAPSGGEGSPLVQPLLVYSLASALMPATAAFLAVTWGVHAEGRFRARPGRPGGSLLNPVLATALRGMALGALVLGVLLVQAWIAGAPGTVAAVSAGVVLVECVVFGAIGAGLSAWAGRRRLAPAAGWMLCIAFVAGAPAAAIALLPLVRAEEPVTVALNVEWAPDGTRVAFRCSEIDGGVSEIYHTERLMWLPALSPPVLFLMLGAEVDKAGHVLGWVPAALQEAADARQVPCVQGQPRSRDEPRMPMALVGFLGQAAVAGAIVAGGYRRKRNLDMARDDPAGISPRA